MEEARRTMVIYDARTGGLFPSVRLVSSVARVNKCANTVATRFYDVKLDVFGMTL